MNFNQYLLKLLKRFVFQIFDFVARIIFIDDNIFSICQNQLKANLELYSALFIIFIDTIFLSKILSLIAFHSIHDHIRPPSDYRKIFMRVFSPHHHWLFFAPFQYSV